MSEAFDSSSPSIDPSETAAAAARARSAARVLVQRAAALAADRKALDIVVLDLIGRSSVTDYFLLCTGRSDIQVQAICERIVEGLRELGERPLAIEGLENGQWALLDYGDVVVHVFQKATRELYDLERLWAEAPRWTYEGGSAIGSART
jgi:ribosome-associated protein